MAPAGMRDRDGPAVKFCRLGCGLVGERGFCSLARRPAPREDSPRPPPGFAGRRHRSPRTGGAVWAGWPGIQEREDLILITVTETESALDTQIQLERVGAFGRPETGAKNTGQPRWRQGVIAAVNDPATKPVLFAAQSGE